jgi:saccharopine dehydrogenase-like NADP-dependent oxidoreductase
MGQTWRAISWTTAASLVSVIEMINEGLLKKEGFIKQEEITFDKFLKTDSGKLFLD